MAEDDAEAAMRSSEWRDGRGGITGRPGRPVGFRQPGGAEQKGEGGFGFWTSAAALAAFRGFCAVSYGRAPLSSEGW